MSKKLQRAFEKQKKSAEPKKIYGLLGIPLNGKRIVEVTNRKPYVYVRLRNNQNEIIQAFNNKVAIAYNLPVIVQREGGRYSVISVDTQRYENNWNSYAPYLPRHGNTHSFNPDEGGGGDVIFVNGRQFVPLLGFPSGTDGANNILIAPYLLENSDGSWKEIGGTGTASLISYNPPTGAVMVLVYMDATTGNPGLVAGSVFNGTITGSTQISPYIPNVPNPSTQIPVSAVRLVSGTSQIVWNNIYDARQYFTSVSTGTGGGGLISGSPDATYLRLDTSNDPLTELLAIVPASSGNGGLYVETKGDDYTVDVEQYVYNSGTVYSPTLFLYRAPGDTTPGIFDSTSHMIEAWQDRNSGTISGKFISFHSDGTDRFYVNPSAAGTGTNTYIDGDFSLSNDGNLLLLANHGSPKTKIAAQGNLEFGLSSTKEVNAGKIGYETINSGYLDIVGAGTVVGSRAVKIYDNMVVNDNLSAGGMNLTNPSLTYDINGSPHAHDNIYTPTAAWTAWTPTITASAGTLTTVSGSGRYFIQGKSVLYQCAVTLTNIGTGSGILQVSLPGGAGTAQTTASGYGYIGLGQKANDNKSLNVVINSGGTIMSVVQYDGTGIIVNGNVLVLSGAYEIP